MEEKDKKDYPKPYGGYSSKSDSDPPKKEPKTKASQKKPKEDPVHIATGSFTYRFICDGTTLRLTEGVAVNTTEARLKELKKYGHVKEVK